MIFEVLMEVKLSMLVSWVVTPCGLVYRYQHFGGTYYQKASINTFILMSLLTATCPPPFIKGKFSSRTVCSTPDHNYGRNSQLESSLFAHIFQFVSTASKHLGITGNETTDVAGTPDVME
jgi:hypothetical protein